MSKILAPQFNHPPRKQRIDYRPDFERYEREKADWMSVNVDATQEEFRAAMAELASRCGI